MKTRRAGPSIGRRKVITQTRVYSEICGKTSYASRKDALARAAAQRRYSGENIQVYRCTRGCHAYHLGHPPGTKKPRLPDAS